MELKKFIIFQIEEIKREFLDTLDALSDDIISQYSPQGHWPIAWIILHCLEIYDKLCFKNFENRYLLTHAEFIEKRPIQKPDVHQSYPPLSEMAERLNAILSAIIDKIQNLPDEQMDKSFYGMESVAVACYRLINHTNSHLRNIWFVLGEFNVGKWSEQKLVLPQ